MIFLNCHWQEFKTYTLEEHLQISIKNNSE